MKTLEWKLHRDSVKPYYTLTLDPLVFEVFESGYSGCDGKWHALLMVRDHSRDHNSEIGVADSLREAQYAVLSWLRKKGREFLTAAGDTPFEHVTGFTKGAADRMAAGIDLWTWQGQIDSRSLLADLRLDYGDPFSLDEAETLVYIGKLRRDER